MSLDMLVQPTQGTAVLNNKETSLWNARPEWSIACAQDLGPSRLFDEPMERIRQFAVAALTQPAGYLFGNVANPAF